MRKKKWTFPGFWAIMEKIPGKEVDTVSNWMNASRMECISGISKMLAYLSSNVRINSKNNRNDLAVISEQTICGLLNRMHGWNLRNANTPKQPNFPGVDLVDELKGVAVQVTVDNSVKKVDHTLAKFKEHKLNRTFNQLILVVISEDEPTAAMKSREDSCFYGHRDIWNITFLSRQIANEQDVEKLRDIAQYLETELGYCPPAAEPEKKTPQKKESWLQKLRKKLAEKTPDPLEPEEEDPGEGFTEEEEAEPKETLGEILTRLLAEQKQKRQAGIDRRKRKKAAAKPRKKGKLWLVAAALLILVAAVLLFPEKPLEEMPPELSDYSVSINGQTVSLPTTLQTLEEMGWVMKDAEEYRQIQVLAHSFDARYGEDGYWSGTATLTNGHGKIEVRLGNASNHTVPFAECIVYEIIFYSSFDSSYTGESVNTLEAPLGLIWKQSSFKDVKWPEGYTKNNSFGITYSYKLGNTQLYEFQFAETSQKLEYLRIRNRDEAAMAALMGPAYDTQPPEYDTEALADWLGVRIAFTVTDLSHNYELPVGATVAAYQEMGYTVEKQPEYVVSMDHENVYFRCDTLNQLRTEVCNPFRRAVTPENCFVCVLDSQHIDTDAALILTFGDGEKGAKISLGGDESMICSELTQRGILVETGDNGELIIYPNRNNRDITIKCWVSRETGKITRIRADICEALQKFMEQQARQNELDQKFAGIG